MPDVFLTESEVGPIDKERTAVSTEELPAEATMVSPAEEAELLAAALTTGGVTVPHPVLTRTETGF